MADVHCCRADIKMQDIHNQMEQPSNTTCPQMENQNSQLQKSFPQTYTTHSTVCNFKTAA
eukprot:12403936-Karenia_brevis.AAC.2